MGLLQRLEVPGAPGRARMLDNEDLRPTPLSRRTWGKVFYGLFWLTAVPNVTNMTSGGSWLTLGMSLWEGVGCSTAGYAIAAALMVVNGRPGAKYHIGFPVACRSSFGVYGAMWPALNRAFMACLWQGVNAVSGAQALYLTLYAIFPTLKNWTNHMDSRSGLTSPEMLMFFLFSGAVAVMFLLDMKKWKYFVHTKMAAFLISAAGMLAWTLTAAGGAGDVLTAPATVHGSTKSWLLLRLVLTQAASCATFISNSSDFQRNATKPSDPILGNLIGFPISNFITQVIGMIVCSSSTKIYGALIWNPITLMKLLLEDNYSSKYRAAAFFIGALQVYSLMFSCLFENVMPCGNDLAALCPRWISIKRGFVICILVSILLNPWYLLGSASVFITVISSYQIFLFSIVGIQLVDYYWVSKGSFDIEQLYTPSKSGKYFYTYGFNLRAFAAYLCGVAVNFAGFLTNFGIIESVKLERSYYFAIFTTTFVAAAVYAGLNVAFPQANKQEVWSEPKGRWEPSDEQLAVGGVAAGRISDSIEGEKDAETLEKADEAAAEVRAAQLPELRV
ncbi:hypothetical protein JCM8097_002886 [Rhodosporidiobolus ruineniae]